MPRRSEEWRSITGGSVPIRGVFSNAPSHTVKLSIKPSVESSVELSVGVNRRLNEGLDLQEEIVKPRESGA